MRRITRGLVEALTLPVTDMWPTCDLCNGPIDAIELVDRVGPTAKVLAKHHGQEELVTFELGTEHWEADDVQRAMRGHRWFKPETKAEDDRSTWDLDDLANGVLP